MYMTILSGCESAAGCKTNNITEVSSKVSSGMLLGARGNSGVIFSRIFSGFSKGVNGLESIGLEQLKKAMESAVKEAYGAVAEPVEGTMLTVLREAVAAAAVATDTEGYFRTLCDEADASLERTPSLLDVLARAGVVDSGGAGLVYVFRGMQAALNGELSADASLSEPVSTSSAVDIDAFTQDSVLEFGYCTEFLLRLQNSKVDVDSFDETEIREYLQGAGESLVFFREGSIIKVHVHTMHPGEILNACQKWGEFLTVKIENMTLQHHENHMEDVSAGKGPKRAQAIVTVACGAGLVRLFSDMGAQVIEGGQTMNPSAQDFVKAFDRVNAKRIYVLPNNSNIIMTAQQAAELYTKDAEVIVLPTASIGAGYAVLGSVDFGSDDADAVIAQAEAVIGAAVTGMVSRSIRETSENKEGDYIGFAGKEILSSSSDRSEAAAQLCGKLGAASCDVLLLIKGADVPQGETDSLVTELQKKYPRTEVVLLDGGQPVFDYIMVIE